MNKEEYAIFPGQIKINNCTYFGLDYELTDFVNHLAEQNQKYKEVLDKVSSQIKLYGKYNGEKCTRGFSMMSADFNKLLDLLKEVSE